MNNQISGSEMSRALALSAARTASRYADLIPNVDIPDGSLPDAEIARFTITEEDVMMANLRMAICGLAHRAIAPGSYTRLVAGGELQMTDTPVEKADHALPVARATGHCLVMGLGLGMVANAMALKPEVTKVTVIEINEDVITLVKPSLHEKVEVIHADALTWEPPKGKKWEVIWHDIWPSICLDDCETRSLLARRYSRRWTVYHGAWAKDEIRRLQQGRY